VVSYGELGEFTKLGQINGASICMAKSAISDSTIAEFPTFATVYQWIYDGKIRLRGISKNNMRPV